MENQAKKQSHRERVAAVRIAFVAVPAALQSPELMTTIRRTFARVRIRDFSKIMPIPEINALSKAKRRHVIREAIAECDALILVIGPDRKIFGGPFNELGYARESGKFILLWDAVAGRWERFAGADYFKQGTRRFAVLRRWDQRPFAPLAVETPTPAAVSPITSLIGKPAKASAAAARTMRLKVTPAA